MKIIKYIFLIMLVGCSSVDNNFFKIDPLNEDYNQYVKNDSEDNLRHFEILVKDFILTEGFQNQSINSSCMGYLYDLYDRIVTNNELLLDRTIRPNFYFIKSELPFLFSAPSGNYFFSTGIIEKYLKAENIFVSAFTYELIRNHSNIYPAKIIVPVGHIGIERLIYLTRIPVEIKSEIHKRSFYAIKRSGFDGASYLSWLQLQNKNSLDFTLHLGDVRSISKEEYLFKNFIVKEGVFESKGNYYTTNSSTGFYRFLSCFSKE